VDDNISQHHISFHKDVAMSLSRLKNVRARQSDYPGKALHSIGIRARHLGIKLHTCVDKTIMRCDVTTNVQCSRDRLVESISTRYSLASAPFFGVLRSHLHSLACSYKLQRNTTYEMSTVHNPGKFSNLCPTAACEYLGKNPSPFLSPCSSIYLSR
jgi:hypothetical protein